jgi:hypothetical protein
LDSENVKLIFFKLLVTIKRSIKWIKFRFKR